LNLEAEASLLKLEKDQARMKEKELLDTVEMWKSKLLEREKKHMIDLIDN
jgi:hypothetical protein